jgi:predicted O-methyltransferase YrrM
MLETYIRRIQAEGLKPALRKAANPGVLYRHTLRLLGRRSAPHSNPYHDTPLREEDVSFCARLLDVTASEIEQVIAELEDDTAFLSELQMRYHEYRPNSPFSVGRFRVWYAIARVLQPESVVETGVHDGLSTAVLLRALERNATGHLTSIDLPSTDLPPEVEGPGWLVPPGLRWRWTLLLGDAKKLLPDAAQRAAPIGLFIHDSDHSQAHQTFELETVRPHLASGAVVISDQDYPFDAALDDFAARVEGSHFRLLTAAPDAEDPHGSYAGGIRLP